MKNTLTHLMMAVALVCASMSAYAAPSFNPEPLEPAVTVAPDSIRHVRTVAEWDMLSESLVEALKSDNAGIQQSAMQLVILYGDNVNVRPAVHQVMHIYRDNPNEDMRHLAAITLAHMNSRLARGFLELSVEFEKSPAIKQTIESLLSN